MGIMKNISVAVDEVIDIMGDKWFLDYRNNILYQADFDNMLLCPKVILSKGETYAEYPKVYGGIIHVQGKIYVVPEAPIPIVVYDIASGEVDYIDYRMEPDGFLGKVFAAALQRDEYIYFIPCCCGHIVKLNTKNNSLCYYSLKEYFSDDKIPAFLWNSFVASDSELLFTTFLGSQVLRFDFGTGKVDSVLSLPKESGIAGIVGNDKNLWLFPLATSRVYKIDRTNMTIVDEHVDFPEGYIAGEWSWSKMVDLGQRVYMLPRTANMLLVLDKNTGSINLVERLEREDTDEYFEKYYPYSCVTQYQGNIILFDSISQNVKIYNDSMECFKQVNFCTDVTLLAQIKQGKVDVQKENEIWDLSIFIKSLDMN